MTQFKASLPVLEGIVYQKVSNFRLKTEAPTYYLRLKCGLLFVHQDDDQSHQFTHVLAGATVSNGLYPNSVVIQSGGRIIFRFVCRSFAEHSAWMYALNASSNWKLDSFYNKIETIATGSNGTVIKASHKTTNDKFAIKCLPHDRVGKFELPIVTSVDHKNILSAVEVLHNSTETYIVFPLAFGTLRTVGSLSESQVKVLARQLIEGVEYLHQRSIVHRDLTPYNVLRKKDGDWVIADFGNASMMEVGEKIYSFDADMYVSPRYAAPELLRLTSHDGACDLWSIGVLIYEALSNRKPFDGANCKEVRHKVVNGEFEMIGEEWEPVSEDAKDFVRKLLDVDRNTRNYSDKALKHRWIAENKA